MAAIQLLPLPIIAFMRPCCSLPVLGVEADRLSDESGERRHYLSACFTFSTAGLHSWFHHGTLRQDGGLSQRSSWAIWPLEGSMKGQRKVEAFRARLDDEIMRSMVDDFPEDGLILVPRSSGVMIVASRWSVIAAKMDLPARFSVELDSHKLWWALKSPATMKGSWGAVVARRWYRLLRGCSWGLTVSELLYSGLGGPCGSVLSALSNGETAEEMDWGTKALVRARISCSSLSNRAVWASLIEMPLVAAVFRRAFISWYAGQILEEIEVTGSVHEIALPATSVRFMSISRCSLETGRTERSPPSNTSESLTSPASSLRARWNASWL
ncbi:hypothetical protein DAPPUDRAFT_106661 [Daphnia pulex]|uniref:Uncharacterized protein n=1 Tax=Daphnia pulex TaxID=6669 RepID=E9GUN2_DAPPU|nr:hypothetical protein DAPPUDRAFT_106661 [Daphnia pulex]|eukprot:EFX76759.1 hypothetical protein DAPPUDRAFT_106661 [Daphnia pulex]